MAIIASVAGREKGDGKGRVQGGSMGCVSDSDQRLSQRRDAVRPLLPKREDSKILYI